MADLLAQFGQLAAQLVIVEVAQFFSFHGPALSVLQPSSGSKACATPSETPRAPARLRRLPSRIKSGRAAPLRPTFRARPYLYPYEFRAAFLSAVYREISESKPCRHA